MPMLCTTRVLLALAISMLAPIGFCAAAELQIAVLDPAGQPVQNVVLIATATNSVLPHANSSVTKPAIMDQINKEFVPEILVIRTGTQVLFPNSDSVAHQVYSFSATKRFSLPLYRGRPYPPELFDQPGIVTLGCNIHDHMVGYIVVTESPHFAQTDAQGRASLHALGNGEYRVSAWHPRFSEAVADQSLVIADNQTSTTTFHLTKALRPNARRTTLSRTRDY